MNVGFIGLGNVGHELASSLLRNDYRLAVRAWIDDEPEAPGAEVVVRGRR